MRYAPHADDARGAEQPPGTSGRGRDNWLWVVVAGAAPPAGESEAGIDEVPSPGLGCENAHFREGHEFFDSVDQQLPWPVMAQRCVAAAHPGCALRVKRCLGCLEPKAVALNAPSRAASRAFTEPKRML